MLFRTKTKHGFPATSCTCVCSYLNRFLLHSVVINKWITQDTSPVADPGFPIGGRRPRRGGANSRAATFRKNLYVKMKESGPVGGRALVAPPGSATDL